MPLQIAAGGVERQRLSVLYALPGFGLHGAIGGIEDTVDDIAILEGFARRLSGSGAVQEVFHLFPIPVDPGFIDWRKEPARLGIGLLHDIARAGP